MKSVTQMSNWQSLVTLMQGPVSMLESLHPLPHHVPPPSALGALESAQFRKEPFLSTKKNHVNCARSFLVTPSIFAKFVARNQMRARATNPGAKPSISSTYNPDVRQTHHSDISARLIVHVNSLRNLRDRAASFRHQDSIPGHEAMMVCNRHFHSWTLLRSGLNSNANNCRVG